MCTPSSSRAASVERADVSNARCAKCGETVQVTARRDGSFLVGVNCDCDAGLVFGVSSPSNPSAGTAPQYGVWHQRCPKCGTDRLSPNVDPGELSCDECGYSTTVLRSAGTARPPAAPHPLAAIDNIFRFAREECYPDELEIVEAAEAYVAALRSALAERDAECERLRNVLGEALTAASNGIACVNEDDDRVLMEIDWMHEAYDAIHHGASAAVAPAARETQETNEK